ncbi:MAG: RIP metalloprotease RseP [Bdellovibrionaceae bacterium]|nr:RIP metalloprotease RseP [Pseudobdellovibrionaceae bacterium]
MEIFLSFLEFIQKVLFALGPFVLLLGVLIFIHELGHFLVARYFGVKVEVFSLGFGPKILKYKKGDTLYCLSLLPLGGYVKMFGSNPLEEIDEREKQKAFLYKPVLQKWLIAFAGPFMNLIFTLFTFLLLSKIGIPSLPPQLGDIKKGSQAYQEGFRSGDKLLSVDGEKISYYGEVVKRLKQAGGENLIFKIRDKSEKTKKISSFIQTKKNTNPLEVKKEVGFIEGLTALSQGLRVGVIKNSLAYRRGLRTFDEILKVNGTALRYWRDLENFIKKEKILKITFKREFEKKTIRFLNRKQESSLKALGIEPSFLYIDKVGSKTPASEAGLKRGDKLISIQDQKIQSWDQVLKEVENSSGSELKIQYQRGEKQHTVFVSPISLFVEGNIKKRYMLGIVSAGLNVWPEEILIKRNFLESISYSFSETKRWLVIISVSLARLVQGEISFRTLGGPITIGRIAHRSFHHNVFSFLSLMALISLNLFFLNLLPIPVLDGGYILFFTIEGILRRSISLKTFVLAQQVGFVFIISFMGLAFFNDIYNLLKAW